MKGEEPIRIGYTAGQNVTLDRLQDQIEWYDNNAGKNQRIFKRLKIATMLAAALVPLFAAVGKLSFLTAGLGVLIVILEGLQQLNQYQSNWILYRSTCESLKHEKFLYLANAGPYTSPDNAAVLLAERLESLVSQEHAKWASEREPSDKSGAKAKT